MNHRIHRIPLVVLAAVTLSLLHGIGHSGTEELQVRERMLQMKAMQHRMLLDEPMHERAERREAEERFRAWLKQHRAHDRGARLKPLDTLAGAPGPNGTPIPRAPRHASTTAARRAQALATNVRANDPSGDTAGGSAQSEVSIVADGQNMVAAWNDGEGFVTARSTQGYGYSTDGGVTWTDGGSPPAVVVGKWVSDPVLTVDLTRHIFYYAALTEPSAATNGIGVVAGTFSGSTFAWGTPSSVIAGSNSTFAFDKEWVACDPNTGNVYVVYSRFDAFGDQIDFRASSDGGVTWPNANAKTLSSANDQGYVQGARVAVGPNGEIHTVWYAIGVADSTASNYDSPYGRDYFRYRKGTLVGSGSPGATTFAAQTTLDSVYSAYSNGGPGFNRGGGVTFPGLAVDLSTGSNRGRVFVSWNECQNFYYDNLGAVTGPAELPDAGSSGSTARAFMLGGYIRGQITSFDVDWWKFTGSAGQTVIFFVDSLNVSLDLSFELYASNGVDQLAYNENGPGGFNLIVFTLPSNGTYYLRASAADLTSTGRYNIATGLYTTQGGKLADRSRDHRDAFVKYTDASGAWTNPPVRVNQEPAGFDDWLPEVAVTGGGTPMVAWFDFHDAPAGRFVGAGSNVYLARSPDGGASWSAGSPVTDHTTYWSTLPTNIAPNQGDYIALFGGPNGVLVGWADGRGGDPDTYMASIDVGYTAIAVSLASASATPDQVSIAWVASVPLANAVVERRTETGDWTAVASLIPDGVGRMAYDDRTVLAGTRYGYRLRIFDGGVEQVLGEAWVDVPNRLSFALEGVRPNPSRGAMRISFSLPDDAPASLELVDISGRRVTERQVGSLGGGAHTLELTTDRPVPAGVYLLRLTRGGRVLVSRVNIL